MKTILLIIGLIIAIAASIYFTYERSFITRNFELIDSEAELEEESSEEAVPENDSETEPESGEAQSIPDQDVPSAE
jgi:hypothetical protein